MLSDLLRLIEPETAHNLALLALRAGVVPGDSGVDDPVLAVEAFGRRLSNPIGLAAGFDKNAVAVSALGRLGFGFVEVGTVTPRPQAGNVRPRLFRLTEDSAVINRFGFNNAGVEDFVARLKRVPRGAFAVGANVGVNKDFSAPDKDYPVMVEAVAPWADYVTINVSSPNTPGLRALQGGLDRILGGVVCEKPVFVKIAPDLDDEALGAVVCVCVARGVAGMIVSNTTVARPDSLRGAAKGEAGGLSGRPLFGPSTEMLRKVWRLAEGRLVLVGVGGVFGAEDAFAKILAGASVVQVYTGFAYGGPGFVRRVKDGLAVLVKERGFRSVADAVGAGN
jgi:dihydroorotate dehydrogenase